MNQESPTGVYKVYELRYSRSENRDCLALDYSRVQDSKTHVSELLVADNGDYLLIGAC